MLIAINFHYIRESFDYPFAGIHGVTPAEFESQLETLSNIGEFVGLCDIVDELNGKNKLPEKSFVVTFDDGLREQYEVAWPILKKMGIPAIFYINTKPIDLLLLENVHKIHLTRAHTCPKKLLSVLTNIVEAYDIDIKALTTDKELPMKQYHYDTCENAILKYFLNFRIDFKLREKIVNQLFEECMTLNENSVASELYMSKKQVVSLARVDMIGTHGHAHLPAGKLSKTEFYDELNTSISLLKDWSGGLSPLTYSFPYGSKAACNTFLSELAKEFDLRFAFTMERAANKEVRNFPLYLSRFACSDLPGGNHPKYSELLFDEVHHRTWFQD